MRRLMPTAERTMTPRASDQDEQRDDLTEEMRLENGARGARGILLSTKRSGAVMYPAFECGRFDRWP